MARPRRPAFESRVARFGPSVRSDEDVQGSDRGPRAAPRPVVGCFRDRNHVRHAAHRSEPPQYGPRDQVSPTRASLENSARTFPVRTRWCSRPCSSRHSRRGSGSSSHVTSPSSTAMRIPGTSSFPGPAGARRTLSIGRHGTGTLARAISRTSWHCTWDPDTRQRLELPPLQLYHQELIRVGVRSYSFADLVLDYRRCVVRNRTFPIIFWSRGFPRKAWRYRLRLRPRGVPRPRRRRTSVRIPAYGDIRLFPGAHRTMIALLGLALATHLQGGIPSWTLESNSHSHDRR